MIVTLNPPTSVLGYCELEFEEWKGMGDPNTYSE